MRDSPRPRRITGRPRRRTIPVSAHLVAAELRMALRRPDFTLFVFAAAATSHILAPTSADRYTTVLIGNAVPVMNADTWLATTAVLLALCLIPYYILTLGLGVRRDQLAGTADLIHLQSASPATTYVSRLVAQWIKALLHGVLLLALLSWSAVNAFGAMPSMTAYMAFAMVLLPTVAAVSALAVMTDRFLPGTLAQVATAFAIWMGVSVALAVTAVDSVGLDLLRGHFSGDPFRNGQSGDTAISLGLLPVGDKAFIIWDTLTVPGTWLTARAAWLAAGAGAALAATLVTVLSGTAAAPRERPVRGAEPAGPEMPAGSPAPASGPRRAMPSAGAAFPAVMVLLARRLTRRRQAVFLFPALAAVLAATGAPFSSAAATALVFPVLVLTGLPGTARPAELALLQPALWRPTPTIFMLMLLAALTVGPLLPGLIQMPGPQAVQACLWLCTLVGVLLAGFSIIAERVLSLSVFLMMWYLFYVNAPPFGLDIMGVSTGTPAFLAAGALILTGLCLFFLWADKCAIGARRA